jgi:hypothetical protein
MIFKVALIVVFIGTLNLIDCEIKVGPIGYKESITLTCADTTNADFYVVKPLKVDSEKKEGEKADAKEQKIENLENKFVVEGNTLEIKDIRGEEIKSTFSCREKDSEGKLKTFSFKGVKPYIYKPEKLSITETTGGNAKLKCQLLFGSDSPKWTWTKDGDNVTLSNDNNYQIEGAETNETTLTIKNVDEIHKGEYACILTNIHGSVEEKIHLRVKSALAALWPFLGIVAEVVILCIIILSYETRCGKKKNTEEDENEQAQNLMGREGAQSDLKKRTVKA